MAEINPGTKIARLIERMRPLADWYAQNRPSVDTIRVTADDLKLLSDNEAAAIANGIYADNKGLKWRNFYLKSA
jgi:hypothetical protein